MNPLELVKLTALMERTSGHPDVKIGLIDGPVVVQHADLAVEHLREISGNTRATCTQANSTACMHGTFIAGILSAKRHSLAPAICPDCTLLIRPILTESRSGRAPMPSATPATLAAAIIACIDAGARLINLSLGLAQPLADVDRALQEALNLAARRGVIIVAAAGNQGTLASSAITGHPWVIPVAACDLLGRPTTTSNLGSAIGRQGLSAPGDSIVSLSAGGGSFMLGGTSVAAPFVTGAIALLWSEFPAATAAQIRLAIIYSKVPRRAALIPPLLDASAACQFLSNANARRQTA